jgi:DNA-binding MarR family transcriptional regulator
MPEQRTAPVQPRWLSAEEQVVWRAFIEATQMLTDRLDQELQRDSGIPHTYYEVLVRLSEVPDRRLRMSALADRSLSSRSRLSHAVARLEQNGWVRRELCATDRRGQLAVLTDAGFAALEAAAPGHVEGVRTHLLDQLTPEQVRQLGEICAAVAAGLRDACDADADALDGLADEGHRD